VIYIYIAEFIGCLRKMLIVKNGGKLAQKIMIVLALMVVGSAAYGATEERVITAERMSGDQSLGAIMRKTKEEFGEGVDQSEIKRITTVRYLVEQLATLEEALWTNDASGRPQILQLYSGIQRIMSKRNADEMALEVGDVVTEFLGNIPGVRSDLIIVRKHLVETMVKYVTFFGCGNHEMSVVRALAKVLQECNSGQTIAQKVITSRGTLARKIANSPEEAKWAMSAYVGENGDYGTQGIGDNTPEKISRNLAKLQKDRDKVAYLTLRASGFLDRPPVGVFGTYVTGVSPTLIVSYGPSGNNDGTQLLVRYGLTWENKRGTMQPSFVEDESFSSGMRSGILRDGNTCYIISTLQMIFNSAPDLRDEIENAGLALSSTGEKGDLLVAIRRVYKEYKEEKIVQTGTVEALRNTFLQWDGSDRKPNLKRYMGPSQNDASEFCRSMELALWDVISEGERTAEPKWVNLTAREMIKQTVIEMGSGEKITGTDTEMVYKTLFNGLSGNLKTHLEGTTGEDEIRRTLLKAWERGEDMFDGDLQMYIVGLNDRIRNSLGVEGSNLVVLACVKSAIDDWFRDALKAAEGENDKLKKLDELNLEIEQRSKWLAERWTPGEMERHVELTGGGRRVSYDGSTTELTVEDRLKEMEGGELIYGAYIPQKKVELVMRAPSYLRMNMGGITANAMGSNIRRCSSRNTPLRFELGVIGAKEKAQYQLFGAIIHGGSTNAGHYTYMQRTGRGTYVLADDREVRSMDNQSAMNRIQGDDTRGPVGTVIDYVQYRADNVVDGEWVDDIQE
jgi:hypothetical protein